MSLIHEALQKAENERRAGELPPLVSRSREPNRSARDPISPLWWILGLVILGAAGYSNRDLLLSKSSEAPVARNAAIKPDRSAEDRSANLARPAQKPVAVREPARPRPPAMDAKTAATVDALSAHMGFGRSLEPDRPDVPEQTPIAPPPPPPPVPKPVLPADVPAQDVVQDAPVQHVEPESVGEVPVASSPANTVAATSSVDRREGAATEHTVPMREPSSTQVATVPAERPDGAVTPMLFELPLATRQNLPPLKVSMQVFHADPTRRFAIIDGKRVSEGGVVGNELNLLEIQRDAMLLEHRGTRFLLPRLGR